MNDNAVHQEQCGRRNRFKGRSDLRCLQDIQAEIQLKSSFESKLKIMKYNLICSYILEFGVKILFAKRPLPLKKRSKDQQPIE